MKKREYTTMIKGTPSDMSEARFSFLISAFEMNHLLEKTHSSNLGLFLLLL